MLGIELKLSGERGQSRCPHCNSLIRVASLVFADIESTRSDATGHVIISKARIDKVLATCNNWHSWALDVPA